MSEDAKLKLFAKLAVDPTINLRELTKELDTSYGVLFNWRKEYTEAVKRENLHELINADELVLERAAEMIRQEVELLGETELVKEVDDAINKFDALSVLQVKSQTIANKLMDRIDMLSSTVTDAREVKTLTSALGELHSAFFNPRGTQIAIMNSTDSTSQVTKFRSLMGD